MFFVCLNLSITRSLFQLLCVEKSQTRSGNRTTTSQASAQSRTSQSKTFITEMVQYKENKDKMAMLSVITDDGQSSF